MLPEIHEPVASAGFTVTAGAVVGTTVAAVAATAVAAAAAEVDLLCCCLVKCVTTTHLQKLPQSPLPLQPRLLPASTCPRLWKNLGSKTVSDFLCCKYWGNCMKRWV